MSNLFCHRVGEEGVEENRFQTGETVSDEAFLTLINLF